mmetsp:Transcript_14979/g.20039  ORF Transcript_14979/g.20039 Transcript_14979/m.20039 type:complete len:106 (-) Transcript_14979:1445-1762(-)
MDEFVLFDINLDVGHWIGNERIFLSHVVHHLVTKQEIDNIVSKLGRFESDNRAELEQKIHRISGMCNRPGDVIGLSMRDDIYHQQQMKLCEHNLLLVLQQQIALG